MQIGFGDYAPVYNEDVLTLVLVTLVQFLPFVLQAAIVGELVKKMEKGKRGWRFSRNVKKDIRYSSKSDKLHPLTFVFQSYIKIVTKP